MKLFIQQSILIIFIHFSESNADMRPVFLYANKQKKKKKKYKTQFSEQ